ncbi:hypothetical protein PVAND_001878 [Polypedilum vanderplanki]|uniref:Uncharacterized protein n=1 Tax=Polypedilum vanderplanki TaxID=319348 RepID=A0A9J6BPR8_POLVA|nr:hypothetical protein PVAND_001878 [Polypedilum vanderplanki]
MFLIRFLIVALCIHQLFCDSTEGSQTNEQDKPTLVLIEDTPDQFIITRPSKTDDVYDKFLTFLYRHDTLKQESKQQK